MKNPTSLQDASIRFTTGEFAKLYGIRKDTLFFYDREGLFSPTLREQNGYRYYTADQCPLFDAILMLKESGMEIAQIKEYLQSATPERLILVMQDHIQRLEQQKAKLSRTIGQMQNTIGGIQGALEQRADVPFLRHTKAMRYVAFPFGYEPAQRRERIAQVKRHYIYCKQNDMLADHLRGGLVTKENLEKGVFVREFHLTLLPEDASSRYLKTRPAGLMATLIHMGKEDLDAGYLRLMDYIRAEGLQILGDAFERELVGRAAQPDGAKHMISIEIPVGH